jgi:hypothetical protein
MAETNDNAQTLTRKLQSLINNCGQLDKDYKRKHEELKIVMSGFKQTVEYINNRIQNMGEGSGELIEHLMTMINNNASEIIGQGAQARLQELRDAQDNLMEEFKATVQGVEGTVQGIDSLLTQIDTLNQIGGSKRSKRSKKNKKGKRLFRKGGKLSKRK